MRRMDFLTPLSRERLCCLCAARRRRRRLSAGDQATEPRRSRSSHPGAVCLSNAFWSARNHFFTVFHFLFQLCSAYAQTKHVFLRFINIYIYIYIWVYIHPKIMFQMVSILHDSTTLPRRVYRAPSVPACPATSAAASRNTTKVSPTSEGRLGRLGE